MTLWLDRESVDIAQSVSSDRDISQVLENAFKTFHAYLVVKIYSGLSATWSVPEL